MFRLLKRKEKTQKCEGEKKIYVFKSVFPSKEVEEEVMRFLREEEEKNKKYS